VGASGKDAPNVGVYNEKGTVTVFVLNTLDE